MDTLTFPYYHVALSFLPGIGPVQARHLISYCGSAEAIFKEKKRNLMKIPGIGPKTIETICTQNIFKQVDQEYHFIEKHEIRVLLYSDARYPARLSHCQDAPLLLYQKGETNLNATHTMAIIGTRKATTYGKDFTDQFIHDISGQLSVLVISGLALGIDGHAHKKSITYHLPTIAVFGHGLQTIYPATHKKLAADILKSGGSWISEYHSQEKIVPANFPRRNRIIAGMADATIVIESACQGGAVITANIANSYNREVYALPGRYKDTYSQGCNFLIKTHKAHMIESAEDFLYHMGWKEQTHQPKPLQKELFIQLTHAEEKIMNIFNQNDSTDMDTLLYETNLNRGTLASTLLDLELKGLIQSLPGKRYTLR